MKRSAFTLVLGILIGIIGTLGYVEPTGGQYTYMAQPASAAWFNNGPTPAYQASSARMRC